MGSEGFINTLPSWLNLESFSVIRLSSFVVSLYIAVFLFRLKGRSIPTVLLAWAFTGGAFVNLSTFLEFASIYYWQPDNLKNLAIPFMAVIAASLAAVSLVSFGYHFPHFQKPDRREYRVVLAFCSIVNLGTLVLTYYNFVLLERGRSYFGFEQTYYVVFYLVLTVQFVLTVFLLLRKAVRFSDGKARSWLSRLLSCQGKDARAARSIALVLFLLSVVVGFYVIMTLGLLPFYLATYFIWLIFLLFYFSFVVTYLNHTVERTTFQVKLVGLALVFVVGILGLVSIIVGMSYENDYVNKDRMVGGQTIHFEPNRFGSYTISRIPLRFDEKIGGKIEVAYGAVKPLKLGFVFPFFGQAYKEVQLLHGPMIYLGEIIREDGWGGYHPQPAIAPLLMDLDPERGSGIYLNNGIERLTITWYQLPEPDRSNSNTVQLTLDRDGSMDFSYRELEMENGYSAVRMFVYTTANLTGLHPGTSGEPIASGPKLIGIHPGKRNAELQSIHFTADLPYISRSPGAIFEAYEIDFYTYLHSRMAVLVLVLTVSSLLILFIFPLLFKTSLIRPLQALYRGMQSADRGDLEVVLSPQSNDEIGALTRYFNGMLQSIKKAEANFKALAENAQEGILILSEQGKTIYTNRRVAEITGLTGSRLMEIPPQELIRLEGWTGEGRRFWKELGRRSETKGYEGSVRARHGVDIPIELTVSQTLWHGLPACVIILRDISERKRSEEEARGLQQRLMQTDKLITLGVLAAAEAHEINNPNQAILSRTRMLKRAWPQIRQILETYFGQEDHFLIAGLEQEEFIGMVAEWLAEVEKCSERIDGIVKNLKLFSSGDPENRMNSLNINSVVRSAVELMSSLNLIKRATDHFTLQLEEGLPNIRGSAQQIEEVIINLISNACQSLSAREKSISLITSYDKKGKAVLLKVCDQGCGIPEDQLGEIKRLFFTTKLEAGGTGLGLYVTDLIVQDHRGSLDFTSEVGKGTEVTVAFPAEEGA
jgi:PAS domain S-box-containing protein